MGAAGGVGVAEPVPVLNILDLEIINSSYQVFACGCAWLASLFRDVRDKPYFAELIGSMLRIIPRPRDSRLKCLTFAPDPHINLRVGPVGAA